MSKKILTSWWTGERRLPRHCHPYQFLLKSFRFPGAKTARKRFLRWKMGFSAAKILPCPPYMPLGTIESREGFGPLELSEGFSTVWAPSRNRRGFFAGGRTDSSDTEQTCILYNNKRIMYNNVIKQNKKVKLMRFKWSEKGLQPQVNYDIMNYPSGNGTCIP